MKEAAPNEMPSDFFLPFCSGKPPKPKAYRERARKAYLSFAKQRRVKPRTMCKAIGMQLRFVVRVAVKSDPYSKLEIL